MWTVPVSVLVLALAPVAEAREWRKLATPHFELYTTAGDKRGRDAIAYFEQVRDVFTHIRGPQPTARKIRLIAFSSEKEYEPFRVAPASPAYYVRSHDLDCIVLSSISGDYSPLAVHEYTHLWMRDTGATLPTWLHEGLAELHSTLNQREGKVWIGNAIPARLRLLREKRWVPFDRLVRIDADSPEFTESDRAGIFYAESWLLVHMLYLDEAFRPRWGAFIKGLVETGSTEQAAAQAYGNTLADLQREAQAYAHRSSLPALWFDAHLDRTSDAPAVSEPSDVELAVVFAQLYRLIGKPEAGQKLLSGVAANASSDAAIEAERGALAWKAGDLNAARAHYVKAVELRSTDAQMYIDYAELIQDDRPEDAARALARALELRPDSREAHFLLGYLFARQNKWPEALKQLDAVHEVGPERAFLFFHLRARAQFESGLAKEARQSAAMAQKYASNPSEAAQAKALAQLIGPDSEPPRPSAPEASAQAPKSDSRRSVNGTLQLLDCRRAGSRMHIQTAHGELTLLIEDPARVELTTSDSRASINLTCGPQQSRRVRVEYSPGGPADVAGRLERLELLP